jgi:hypothetical protein
MRVVPLGFAVALGFPHRNRAESRGRRASVARCVAPADPTRLDLRSGIRGVLWPPRGGTSQSIHAFQLRAQSRAHQLRAQSRAQQQDHPHGPHQNPFIRRRRHALCPRYTGNGSGPTAIAATRRSRQRRNGPSSRSPGEMNYEAPKAPVTTNDRGVTMPADASKPDGSNQGEGRRLRAA